MGGGLNKREKKKKKINKMQKNIFRKECRKKMPKKNQKKCPRFYSKKLAKI